MKRLILSLLLNLLLYNFGFSQPINTQVKGAVSPSPEASSLGKFQEHPVDFAHGLANINFPIYQINHGPLSVNVALRYHGSGLNVRNIESWCGAGFALEGQYMVSRSVQGISDDGASGYYAIGNTLDVSDINHRRDVALSSRDGESDIYSYAMPGYSGKFYFDENQTAQFVPKTDLKIKVIHSSPFFEGFILTDPNGTKYYFGYIDASDKGYVELTIPDTEGTDSYRSGFYLARIESFDGVYKIDYNYEDNYTYSYDQISVCKIITYTSSGCHSGGQLNSCQNATSFLVDIEGKKLQSISSPVATINFESTGARQDVTSGNTLDKIKLTTGTFCKEYKLTYGYFEDTNSSGEASYRLKLDKLQEQTCTGDTLPAFRFDYYGDIINGKPFFINRNSRQIDHWGYYNGKMLNESTGTINIPSTTVPYLSTTLTKGASDRTTDFSSMVQGSLKAIHNKKGGSTHFEYEANSYPGTVTGSETVHFSLASCIDNGTGCCLEKEEKNDTTFISQTFIDDATFDLYLKPSCINPDENYFDIRVNVYEKVNGTFVYRTEISFDQDVTTETTTPKQPLSSLYAFQPNVQYNFEIKTTDAYGRFRIYNAPQFTDNIDVGGLRIKKINYKDGIDTGNDVSREYFYLKEEGGTLSSGILVKEPIYGYSLQAEHIEGVLSDEVAMAIHSEQSLIPLSSFQGSHISYSRVEERRTGNGKTVYNYDIVYSGIDKNYPSAPLYYQKNAGQLKTSAIQKEDGTTVNEATITPADKNYTYGPTFFKALLIVQPPFCGGGTIEAEAYYIAATEYDIRSSIYLVKESETIQDGVTSLNTTTYDPLERHFFPIAQTTINSDGTVFSAENSYVFDDSLIYGNHSFTYDSMVVRNQISTPIQVVEKANGIITRGTRIGFNSFNPTTGGPGVSSNFNAYPYSFSNYEMTWDANGAIVDDGWVLDGNINTYDPLTGQPNQYNKVGWKTETYTWHPVNGLNTSRTFERFNWRKEYYPNSRLVKTEAQIDSQKVHYEYDPLIRLSKISSRENDVVVDIDYQFLEGGNPLNYVNQKTTYAADPLGNSALVEMQNRQYFGGQGRLLQNIQIGHAPNGNDVITAFTYDGEGRLSRSYEPFESLFDTGQYAADTSGVPNTLTEYEASPLNRAIQTTIPAWHPTQNEYGANTIADAVINYQTGGTYTVGSLFKSTALDGNDNKREAFSDLRGNLILERIKSADGSELSDTYRKQDLKEREIAIYPPGTTPDSTGLIYTKRYDVADNLVEKKVPDAAKMEYVYDVRDLPIGMQSGNLRTDGKWMVTEYDDYGRAIKTGLNTSPTTVNEVWNESFYDGDNAAALAQALGFIPTNGFINSSIEIGKLTGTKIRVLNGNTLSGTEVLQALSYNDYGQVVSDLSGNHKGGRIWKYFDYDLADNLVRQKRIFHTTNISVEKRDTLNTTYDNQGRVINIFHTLIGEGRQHISQLDYTIKDEVKTKSLGGTGGGFLQQLDYAYLPSGFLSGINPMMTADDIFQLNINYDQEVNGLSGEGQKNGNISQLRWKVKGGTEQTYGYTYDFKDQLTQAKYGTYSGSTLSITNNYNTNYGYDARGNMMSITREGMYNDGSSFAPQQIDNLNFQPIAGTNKIQKITDTAPCPNNKVIHQELDNTELHAVGQTINADNAVMETAAVTYQAGTSITLQAGFHAKAGTNFIAKIADCPQSGYETDGFVQRSSADIEYDGDGNMTDDPNKGIAVAYNYFNLPSKITFNNGNSIEWLYDGAGKKLQQQVKRNNVVTPLLTIDYLQGIEYQNDTLDAIYLAEAKLLFDKGNVKDYQYYLRDNTGNTRVIFQNDGSDAASIINQSHYYAYGGLMKGDWQTDNRAKYLFNGIEKVDNFGLNVYHAKFRTLDQWSGRWWQVDPKVEVFASWTPYKFGLNNPIIYNDQDGDCEICKETLINVAVFAVAASNSIASNLTANFPGTRGNPSDFGKYSRAAAIGQQTGDVLSLVGGTAGAILGGLAAGGSSLTTPVTGPVGAGAAAVLGTGAVASAGVATTALSNLTGGNGIVQANDKTPSQHFKDKEGASPALKDNAFSPREVSKRQSQTRKDKGLSADPKTPIPDQPPGKNIKQGVHTSEGKTRHSTGERNVASGEEHSRVAKGNRNGNRRN